MPLHFGMVGHVSKYLIVVSVVKIMFRLGRYMFRENKFNRRPMGGSKVLFLLVLALASGKSFCQDSYNLAIAGDYKMPGFTAGRNYTSDIGTEIIDPFSGLLKLVYTDMVIPGNNGLDITIQRYYNSIQDPTTTQGTALMGRSVVGLGWDMHFGRIYPHLDTRFSANDTNPAACKIGNVSSRWNPVLELADGSRKQLVNDDSNDYSFTTSDFWKASCLPTEFDKGNGGLIVYSPNGLTYIFADLGNPIGTLSGNFVFPKNDFAYLLTKVIDSHGNYIEYTYENVFPLDWDSDKRHAVVTQIRRNDGDIQNVFFEYTDIDNENVLLSKVRANSRNVDYEHVKLDGPDSDDVLDRVRREDNSSWQYTYYKFNEIDPSKPSAPGWKSIKKITNPAGATTTYTYDAVDFDPIAFGDSSVVVKKQTGGNVDTNGIWDYEYNPGPNYDETEIRSGEDCTIYQHRGNQSMPNPVGGIVEDLWRKGTLIKLEKRSPSCGTLRQEETYEWEGLLVSNQNEIRALPLAISNQTRTPFLKRKTVERDNTSYVTEYNNPDSFGNPEEIIETQDNKSRTTTRTYTMPSQVWMPHLVETEEISGISGNVEYTYTSKGKLERQDNYGLITEYTYYNTGSNKGSLKSVIDPNNNVTQYSNYHRGIAQTETLPNAEVITRVVNDRGNILSESYDGITTTYTYDDMDRLSIIITPKEDDNDIDFSYDYNSDGYMRTVTRGPLVQESQYDGLGSLIRQTAKGVEDITITASFDSLGRKTFTSYPNEQGGTTFEYDDLGRIKKQTNSDFTTIDYQYLSDNKISISDEKQNVTVNSYLAFGDGEPWLIEIEQPESVSTVIERLDNGLVDYVNQNGVVMDYEYNNYWQLTSETRPETGTTIYSRDGNGNMVSKQVGTSPITVYEYDELDRIDFIDYPNSTPDVDYVYNQRGQLEQLVKGNLTWDYLYDDNGNVTHETLSYSNLEFSVVKYYNNNDVVSGLSYPNGESVAFNPDAYGRIKRVGAYINDVTYYPNGQINTAILGNGVETTIGQSQRLWPTRIQVNNSAVDLIDRDYTYDDSGNVDLITNYLDHTASIDLGYDGLHRLTSSSGVWGAGSINYDDLGNIQDKTMGSQALTYHYDDNTDRLTSITGSKPYNFSYDVYGNVVANGYDTFTYNDASNLVEVPALNLAYEYDGYNRRAVEIKDGVPEKIYLYDSGGQLLFEQNMLDNLDKTYFYLGAHLAASKTVCSTLDSDDDGLSDCLEAQMNLDPFDPSDGNVSEDIDNDGISNSKEIELGMDPNDPSDGLADNDGDGYSNRQEFWLGTNPNNSGEKPRSKFDFEPDFLGFQAWDIGLQSGQITQSALSPDGGLLIGVTDTTEPGNTKIGLTKMGPGGNVDWIKNGISTFSQAPVIAADGTIYIVDGTNLRAFDADGIEKWVVSNVEATNRPAIGNDGTIYIGGKVSEVRQNGYTVTVDGLLALDPNTGAEKWTYQSRKIVKDIVIDSKGAIYIVGKDDLISLNPDGTIKSQYFYYGTPAIGRDGTLYISEENFVFAVDGETGIEKWRHQFPTPSWDFTAPVIGPDGTLYVGRIHGDLYALDHENGNIIWQMAFPNTGYPQGVQHAPTVAANGRIYAVSHSYLYLLNTDGSTRWSQNVGKAITASPTVDIDSTVYITAGSELVAIVDNSGGLGNSPWPHVNGNSSGSGNLCRNYSGHHSVSNDSDSDLIPDCEEVIRGFDPQLAYDYPNDLDGDGLSNSDELAWGTNRFREDTDADGLNDFYEINNGFNPLDYAERLLDTDGDGFSNQQEKVSKTDPLEPTSFPLVGTEEGEFRRLLRKPVSGVAKGINGDIYKTSQSWEYPYNELVAYAQDGTFKWKTPLRGAQNGGPVVASDGTIYVSTGVGLTAISMDGEELWVYPGGYLFSAPPAIGKDGTLYANTTTGRLHAISPQGGKLWEIYNWPGKYSPPVVGQNGDIYTAGYGRIGAYTSDGVEKWLKEVALTDGTTTSSVANALSTGADGTIYTIASSSSKSYLLAIDPETGDTLWEYQSPIKTVHFSTPVVGPDGTIYFSTSTYGGDVYAINPDGTEKWIYDSANYVMLAPQVGADGSIYFGHYQSTIFKILNFVVLNPDGNVRWTQTLNFSGSQIYTLMDEDGVLTVVPGSGGYYKEASNRIHKFATNLGNIGDSAWGVYGKNNQRVNRQSELTISITAPSSGSVSASGESLTLSVYVNDVTDGDLSNEVSWQSDIDGQLGIGNNLSVMLSDGVHQITATATNSAGKSVKVPTMITINPRPVINITGPTNGDSFNEGSTIHFDATAIDSDDGNVAASIEWSSDIDGVIGTGGSIDAVLSPGNHVISVKATDSLGLQAITQITIEVTAAGVFIFKPFLNTLPQSAGV